MNNSEILEEQKSYTIPEQYLKVNPEFKISRITFLKRSVAICILGYMLIAIFTVVEALHYSNTIMYILILLISIPSISIIIKRAHDFWSNWVIFTVNYIYILYIIYKYSEIRGSTIYNLITFQFIYDVWNFIEWIFTTLGFLILSLMPLILHYTLFLRKWHTNYSNNTGIFLIKLLTYLFILGIIHILVLSIIGHMF